MKSKFTATVCAVIAGGLPLFAAEIVKENNAEALNTGSSWVGGVAPGAADVAVWNNTVNAANTAPLDTAATWDGIKILNPGGPVTVGGSALLTLDGGAAPDINLAGATRDLTFEAPVSMGGTMSTEVASGRTHVDLCRPADDHLVRQLGPERLGHRGL